MVNAFVSHELRNPLQSIVAQNIKKSKLYESLKKIIINLTLADPEKGELLGIIADLEKGHSI